MTRPATVLTLALILGPTVSTALAQTPSFTPQQLDQMSQERQQELGPRNWGPPPKVTAGAIPVYPTPVPVVCVSPAHDFEPIYAEPNPASAQIGLAGPQIAVTHEVRNGWRQVLHAGRTFGWIPNADVVAYRPLVPTSWSHCTVAGENATGLILFAHSQK